MARRGPRGDINQKVILDAAMRVLHEETSIVAVSLRKVAREVGVAPNAIYTYFSSMDVVWDQARERLLSGLLETDVTNRGCDRCELRDLIARVTCMSEPALLELYQRQSYLGPQSFRFAETILELTKASPLPSHSARNLVLVWLSGRATLRRQGALDPAQRELQRVETEGEFPLEAAANAESTQHDRVADVQAVLDALQLDCTCGNDA